MPHLSAIYIYPVKSCRGVALDEAILDERGLLHDRQFLIVDAQDRFLTQRSTPTLARIRTALTDDALQLQHAATGTLRVPWRLPDAPTRAVTIWRDTVLASDAGDSAAAWLSDTLGQPCRLVTAGAQSCREVPAVRLPETHRLIFSTPVPVAFPDAFPLLVLSEESLADLNRRLDEPEPLFVDRFRPNLVLSGCAEPYAEDTWPTFGIGAARFFSAGPCGRCVVITTDQQTLERGREPLRTLVTYRRTADGAVVFGQNVIHASPGTRLRVGDAVSLDAVPLLSTR